MAVKVIYIAGVPASGKSTLFKHVREHLFNGAVEFRKGKVRGIKNADERYIMLGVFDGSTFEGTDKLSMTVIDDAIAYIKELSALSSRHVVFVEGDRLFNYRFLSETKATLFLLDANDDVLKERHKMRGDAQTSTFLKSRRSKVENFVAKYGVKRIWNNTVEDSDKILSIILNTSKDYITQNN